MAFLADPDTIVSNFAQATITLEIAVAGKDLCTGIDELLWGFSHVILWNGHFTECKVSEESRTLTEMKFEIAPPANIAWQIYSALKYVEVHREVASEYAKLGPFYAKQFMSYVNLLSGMRDFSFLGLELDYDVLDIENIELNRFTASFKGHCSYAAREDDIFCKEEPVEGQKALPVNYYALFTVSKDLDLSNAGIIKLSNSVKQSSSILPCAESGTCDVSLVQCKENSLYVQFSQLSNNEEPLQLDDGWTWTYEDGEEIVEFVAPKYMKGCNTHAKGLTLENLEAGFNSLDPLESADCRSCDAGHFINEQGLCEKCPWGSWGDDGINCNSCGWSYITPFWGMEDQGKCIKTNHGDFYDWGSYSGDPAGQNFITLGGTPSINMCGPIHAKKELDEKCLELFSAEELEWPEYINLQMWTIERVVCSASTLSGPLFQEFCGESWDKTSDEVMMELFEGNFWDLICYPLKRVVDLEAADTSGECVNLKEETYVMSVDIDLPEMGIDVMTSEILVPLLSEMKNLETMNFGTFSDAMEAMMEAMGMSDMNALTGWNIANNLKDLGMAMPRGFRMKRFSFDAQYQEEEHFCESGQPNRNCWDDACYDAKCATSEDIELKCVMDECDCSAKFYSYSDSLKEYDQCASCEFAQEIENGVLAKVYGSKVEAMYICNEGWIPEGCNSLARCDFSSGGNAITYPKCIPDKCDWPEFIDDGYFYSDWREESYSLTASTCPYKRWGCNSGWYPSGSTMMECVENYEIRPQQPNCVPYDDDREDSDGGEHSDDDSGADGGESAKEGCHFPEYIARGERYMLGEEGDDYAWAVYMCYYPYVMTPNRALIQEAMYSTVEMAKIFERFPVAYCNKNDGNILMMPECQEPEEARHCGLPSYIYHGKAVQVMFPMDMMEDSDLEEKGDTKQMFDDEVMKMMKEVMNDAVINSQPRDETMPFMARYECDEGYVMMKTMRGEMGWCRGDGSMELPRCVPEEDWSEVKFKLVMGDTMKMVDKNGNSFGGIVQAMQVDWNGNSMFTEESWEYACNDGFNDNAAGAICRTQGYRHGMKVEVPKKALKSLLQMAGAQSTDAMMPFGWTEFACEYDDSLANSEHCLATRYDEASEKHGMKAACFAFDVMAVKCFNNADFQVHVDVSFTMRKLTCSAKALKKDMTVDLSNMKLDVTFKIDGEPIETDQISYKKRRGYTAKYSLKKREFECISCEIHAGDMVIAEGEKCR
ncbi:hypothetical protein ACHWQZ_G015976 [Mnemiopsis leidyi]